MASASTATRPGAPTRRRETDVATDVLEKDDIEVRLEKALFGDDAGFLNSLTTQRWGEDAVLQRVRIGKDNSLDDQNNEADPEDLADEDLFFLDAGTGELPAGVARELQKERNADGAKKETSVVR